MTSYRFPVAGVQNRKAAVAVEVTAIFLDYLAPVIAEWGSGWKDRMRRIARRRQECKQAVAKAVREQRRYFRAEVEKARECRERQEGKDR